MTTRPSRRSRAWTARITTAGGLRSTRRGPGPRAGVVGGGGGGYRGGGGGGGYRGGGGGGGYRGGGGGYGDY